MGQSLSEPHSNHADCLVELGNELIYDKRYLLPLPLPLPTSPARLIIIMTTAWVQVASSRPSVQDTSREPSSSRSTRNPTLPSPSNPSSSVSRVRTTPSTSVRAS